MEQSFGLPSWLCRRLVLVTAGLLSIAMPAWGFVPEERWKATASGAEGAMGSPITLTWSIVPDGTLIQGAGSSDLVAFLDGLFGGDPGGADLMHRPWFSLISSSFDHWSQVSGVTYVFEPRDDRQIFGTADGLLGVRGDIRLGGSFVDGGSGTLAYSYFPSNSDVVMDTGDTAFFSNPTQNYRAFRNTLMHELGHGLGLDHVVSNTDAFLMEPTINISFEGPQLDDIRGVQWYYGDALEKARGGLGNNSAPLSTALGQLASGESILVGAGAAPDTRVEPGELDFVSIANNSDADFFSFQVNDPIGLNAVLTPLGGVFNQGVQGGTQSQFNANSRSDLSLTIFDRDGTSPLALANNTAQGGIESVLGLRLTEPGLYFARVSGSSEIVQLYQLELTAIATATLLAGDYDRDGEVSAADYVVWRHSVGLSGLGLAADGNGDQVVDQNDFAVWQANFGIVVGSSTSVLTLSVPEPGTIVFLAITGLFSLSLRSRRY